MLSHDEDGEQTQRTLNRKDPQVVRVPRCWQVDPHTSTGDSQGDLNALGQLTGEHANNAPKNQAAQEPNVPAWSTASKSIPN